MKTKTALLLCCACYSATATSQSLRYVAALPYIGLEAYSKQQVSPFSFTANPAALAQVKHVSFGVYGERRFMLAPLAYYCLATVLPTRLGNLGLQFNYGGYKNFNENRIGLAYARSLGRKLDIGIQFNYYGYRIPGYGNASTINFEAGAIVHFTEQLHFGIHIYNPVAGKLGKGSKEKLAAVYKAGLGYDASDHFYAGVFVTKEEDKPVNVTAGVQYHFSRLFFARAGIASESTVFFAGAGVVWKKLRVDISVSHHPQLGFSPGLLLIMNLKENTK